MIHTETIEEFETQVEEGELTVIHFITRPNVVNYTIGWWVNVIGSIFIRPCGTNDKLGLVLAHNIPVAPAKYYFKNAHEQLHFTLFFPALPKGTTHIDIVEEEGSNRIGLYNFYRVPMSKINSGVPLQRH